MVGRLTRSTTDENRSITPDKNGVAGLSPRSRKCLDMEPKVRTSSVPLSELNGLPTDWGNREECTPLKRTTRSRKNDHVVSGNQPSIFASKKVASSKIAEERATSPEMIPQTPSQPTVSFYKQVATPRTPYTVSSPATPGQTTQRLLVLPTSRRSISTIQNKSATSSATPAKLTGLVSPLPTSTSGAPCMLAGIPTKSFYGGKVCVEPDIKTPSSNSPTETISNQRLKCSVTRSEPSRKLVSSARASSFRRAGRLRRSLGTGGGIKRKRDTFNRGGIFHAIKRPKKKRKVDIKISDLSAMSIELPTRRKSPHTAKLPTPRTPSTKPSGAKVVTPVGAVAASTSSCVTPKTGNFNLSAETSVDYEVKAGQIIFRKAKTPLRRSPRKHCSPLKESYLNGTKGRSANNRRSSGKLFSPQTDFMQPDTNAISPQKHIPSPVKFSVSTDDDEMETNISHLISHLDAEDEIEEEKEYGEGLNDLSGELELDNGSVQQNTKYIESDVEMTAYAAVQDILGELDTPETESECSLLSQSSGEDCSVDNNSSKLFPIFYKNEAQTGAEVSAKKNIASGRRGLVCDDPRQLQIDAGQQRGPTLCLTCSTVYTKGNPADEASHEEYHNGVLTRIKFSGWKNERNCGQFENGRVIMVQPGDPKHMWNKVEDALRVVDSDLGFSEVGIRHPDQTKVFLYISDKTIVGLLLAESIPHGFRIITQKSEQRDNEKLYLCSQVATPVKCGISRVWVLADYRRQRIATRLVERMRASFLLGHYLGEQEFAFSDPTLNGMHFASNYMQREDFLVYNR